MAWAFKTPLRINKFMNCWKLGSTHGRQWGNILSTMSWLTYKIRVFSKWNSKAVYKDSKSAPPSNRRTCLSRATDAKQLTSTHSAFHDFRPPLNPERMNSPSTAFEKRRNWKNSLACYFNSAEVTVPRTIQFMSLVAVWKTLKWGKKI